MKSVKKSSTSRKVKNVSKSISLVDEIKQENNNARAIFNGISEAILGFTPGGIGEQLMQVDTMFKNNRWYLISNMRQLISQMYVEHGILQTLVDIPVDDALRGGIIIKTEQLDESEIEELRVEMEQEGDFTTLGQTAKWNRLFGGAGTIIMTDQDPGTPFEIESIHEDSELEFRDVDMWELFWAKQNTSDYAAVIDGPDLKMPEFYDYYGRPLHHSRVMTMKGIKAPSFIRPRLRGWGVSIVETLAQSINQYYKENNLIFQVLDEFKVDVYKIKNLASTLIQPQGEERIRNRVRLANQQKNYQHALTMDAEDDFMQKELTFSGLAEVMKQIREQVASDMRMPITKIFGTGSQGFSSGEDDLENYNSMVESQVRNKLKFDIIKVIKIRAQRKFGFVPDDITIEFKPLRVLTAEQEENVKNAKHQRLVSTLGLGAMTLKEFKEGCNKENLLPIQIDVDQDFIETPGMEGDEGDEKDPEKAGPASSLSAKPTKNAAADAEIVEFNSLSISEKNYYSRVQNPGKVDEALWSKAKKASKESGINKWAFVTWWYKKHGGSFS